MRTAWSYCNLDVAAWASESGDDQQKFDVSPRGVLRFLSLFNLIDHSIKYKLKLYIHLGYT